jgi:hypothetical protein
MGKNKSIKNTGNFIMTAITPDGGSKRAVVIGLLQNLTKGGMCLFNSSVSERLKGVSTSDRYAEKLSLITPLLLVKPEAPEHTERRKLWT